MTWNADEFVKFCAEVEKDPNYQDFINANLPNDGKSVEEISARGLEAYMQFDVALATALKDC